MTVQLPMVAILTALFVLYAPAVMDILSIVPNQNRLQMIPNWIPVAFAAAYISECWFAVRWVPPFLRGLWHRIEYVMLEEQEQPDPDFKKHRQLEPHWRGIRRFIAFWLPVAILLGLLVLPGAMVEWRWSVAPLPVCRNDHATAFQCGRQWDMWATGPG